MTALAPITADPRLTPMSNQARCHDHEMGERVSMTFRRFLYEGGE